MTPEDISVVVPTLNEQASIASAIHSARAAGATQVIVSDGGSDDGTIDAATAAGASKVIRSIAGRGIQLNSGAFFAQRQYVLFLHADNTLGPDCLQQLCTAGQPVWGAFGHRIDSAKKIYRAIEFGNHLRAKYRGMPFGDQAIFVRRRVFKQQGGFAEIPLMEDVEFSRRLRRIEKPTLLPGLVTISARRWEHRGPLRQTLRNWAIQCRYTLGASPEDLRERYCA